MVNIDSPIEERLLEKTRVVEMFDTAISILEDNRPTKRHNKPRKVFIQYRILNEINTISFGIIAEKVRKDGNPYRSVYAALIIS